MRTVRTGPLIGLAAQVALLAALALTVGLRAPGWAAGLACGVVTCATLSGALNRAGTAAGPAAGGTGRAGLGPADRVTLVRAVLAGGVTALVADSFVRPAQIGVLVGITVVALVLDGVDGFVARRTGTASPLGARFDMEVDAYLILVLSVFVAGTAGAWVLAIGAARYAFVAAGWLLPWLRGALPARYWRKVVAAVQGIVLAVAASGLLTGVATRVALVVALALLAESFGRDVRWQWRHRYAGAALPAGKAPVRPAALAGEPTRGAQPYA